MSHPIYNPTIPHTGMIPGGFWPGRLVRVQGSILPNANSFTLNLMTGPTPLNDDVGLHLSVRFNEHWMILNSKIYHNWGPEERQGNLPLGRGHNFELIVLAEAHQFKIVINGQHFGVFEYRVPVSRLTHFQIEGEVMISLIQFEDPSLNYCGASAPPMTQMSSSTHPLPPPYHHQPPVIRQQSVSQIGWTLDNGGPSSYPAAAGGGGGPSSNVHGGSAAGPQYFPPSYPPPYNGPSSYPPPPPYPYNSPASYYPPPPNYVPPPGYPQQPQAGYSGGYYGGPPPGQAQYNQQPQSKSDGGGPMKMVTNGLNKVGLGSFANKIPGGGGGGGGGQQGSHNNGHSSGALVGTAAAAGIGGLVAGKALKKGKKKKKLIKYGVPIAGIALGGYALKKILD